MVFKRRKKLSYLQSLGAFLYPRTGWLRAISYMVHRLRRLPDTSHKIARGIGVGVFVCFSPFFGFHFLFAIVLAFIIRGNVFAALISTFFGNPITFPIIATVSYRLGSWIMATEMKAPGGGSLIQAFGDAFAEVWQNILAIFGPTGADWTSLHGFFSNVFLPYLVGGIIPGLACGIAAYFLSQPLIMAYQKRRKGKLYAKMKERRRKALNGADDVH